MQWVFDPLSLMQRCLHIEACLAWAAHATEVLHLLVSLHATGESFLVVALGYLHTQRFEAYLGGHA